MHVSNQLVNLKSAQKHDRISDLVAALGIGSRYTELRLDVFLAECMNFWRNHGRPK
jgi:hypothetical protein